VRNYFGAYLLQTLQGLRVGVLISLGFKIGIDVTNFNLNGVPVGRMNMRPGLTRISSPLQPRAEKTEPSTNFFCPC
jgi:hypothetical protein